MRTQTLRAGFWGCLIAASVAGLIGLAAPAPAAAAGADLRRAARRARSLISAW